MSKKIAIINALMEGKDVATIVREVPCHSSYVYNISRECDIKIKYRYHYKLSPENRAEIIRLRKLGLTYERCGIIMSVSNATIWRVCQEDLYGLQCKRPPTSSPGGERSEVSGSAAK